MIIISLYTCLRVHVSVMLRGGDENASNPCNVRCEPTASPSANDDFKNKTSEAQTFRAAKFIVDRKLENDGHALYV